VNNCINFLKKRRLYFEEIDERAAGREDTITEEEEPKLSVQAVNEALFRLPDGYRVVFSLYQMEGYDHQEIAGILNISEQTSKSQYSRARKKLKELLSQPVVSS
jgi:RNA polymerase sigma-70 factor (ECF subfamily)